MQDNIQNNISIVSFYSFTNIENPELLIPKILLIAKKKMVRGTILVAKEGFNGTISGSAEATSIVLNGIIKLTDAIDVNIKTNYDNIHPFHKMKVKLKKEIISMGIEDLDVEKLKGEYIDPQDWDNFISQPDVILVDTRNSYEVEVGTFDGAINPFTETFKEFPKWVSDHKNLFEGKKIAMTCTGGVRCEKSTAYLKSLGYKDVYHLKGGILQYLEDTKNINKKWHGECFVFDDRFAVDDYLSPSLENRSK